MSVSISPGAIALTATLLGKIERHASRQPHHARFRGDVGRMGIAREIGAGRYVDDARATLHHLRGLLRIDEGSDDIHLIHLAEVVLGPIVELPSQKIAALFTRRRGAAARAISAATAARSVIENAWCSTALLAIFN